MKNIKFFLVVLLVSLALIGCECNTVKIDNSQESVVFIGVTSDGAPVATPDIVSVYPGQELVFYSNKELKITFLGRTPESPKREGNFEFSSDGEMNSIKIEVSPEYKDFPVLSKGGDEKMKSYSEEGKAPIDTENFLLIHYLITVDGKTFDPGAKIIKK